mmetsp:Transcript_9754/g.27903  ORF Transcript_9754/g.27903 Transcript_9754/m.27903 type:complete len:299 (+) Transcript_9754:1163-2059(+)
MLERGLLEAHAVVQHAADEGQQGRALAGRGWRHRCARLEGQLPVVRGRAAHVLDLVLKQLLAGAAVRLRHVCQEPQDYLEVPEHVAASGPISQGAGQHPNLKQDLDDAAATGGLHLPLDEDVAGVIHGLLRVHVGEDAQGPLGHPGARRRDIGGFAAVALAARQQEGRGRGLRGRPASPKSIVGGGPHFGRRPAGARGRRGQAGLPQVQMDVVGALRSVVGVGGPAAGIRGGQPQDVEPRQANGAVHRVGRLHGGGEAAQQLGGVPELAQLLVCQAVHHRALRARRDGEHRDLLDGLA